jgi:hypothetical protein
LSLKKDDMKGKMSPETLEPLEDLILREVGIGDAVLHVAGSQVVASREEAQLDRTHGVTGVKNQLLLFQECLPAQAQLTQLLY